MASKKKAEAKAPAKPKAPAKGKGKTGKADKNDEGASVVKLPMFEGAQVLEVLETDVNGKWNHCKMSDGTTKHVPLELFK